MKILFVSVYYGIGDYLSTNGLINFLSIYYDQIFILCHWNDVEFLNLMYRNNDRILKTTSEICLKISLCE